MAPPSKTPAKATPKSSVAKLSPKKPSRPRAKKAPKTAAKSGTRTALVVLGMHRSGTSALTGVLARMGCDLPKTEMPQNDSNAKGFYESQEVCALNNALLESAGSNWSDWQPLSPSWAKSTRAEEFQEAIAQVITGEFGNSRLFALKDPRICRLLPFWGQAIQQAGCDVVVLHTHRNPLEVAQSLQDRKKMPMATGLMVWLRHVLDAELSSRTHTRSFTSYSRTLQNWRREVDHIEAGLGIIFPRRSLKTAAEIDEFLTHALKHFNHTVEDVIAHNLVNGWVRDVYEILEKWADTGERTSDHKKLDQINSLFTTSAENFGPVVHGVQDEVPLRTKKQVANLKAQVKTLETNSGVQEEAAAEIKRLTKQIEEATANAQLAEETHKKVASERRRAIETRDTAVEARNALTAEHTAQAQQITMLEQTLQNQARIIGESNIQQALLVQEAQSRQDELAQMVQMTKSLVDQQGAMRDTQNTMRDTLADWKTMHTERVSTLQNDLSASRKAAAQAQSDQRAHEDAKNDLTQKLKALEAEQAALQASAKDQANTLSTTQSALRQRQLESEQAHETIKLLKADIARMIQEQANQANIPTETVTALENLLADRSLDVARYEQENADLGAQLKSRYQEIAELTALTANVTQELDQLKTENDRMHLDTSRNLKKQAQQINIQQAEIKATMDTLHEAKVAREYFETTLASLQKSTSWRLTGPLRRLARLFGRS